MSAAREPELVDTEEGLVALARSLAQAESIALDVEADGLYRYRARLCTLQLATEARVVIVDTLALRDLSVLVPLFGADGPKKLLHDAAFDARLLRERGVPIAHVLDTAVCARFLGEPAQGLASLVQKHFDIGLPKDRQRADWGVRPLDEEAVRYLAGDVLHLHALAELLLGAAAERGILGEIEEECLYVLSRSTDPSVAVPAWTRVKGCADLLPAGRAILRELCRVREEAAERRDVPPFKVLGNEALLAIARRRPRTRHDLRAVAGEVAARNAELTEQLLDAVHKGEALEDVPAEELRPAGGGSASDSPELTDSRPTIRTREKALQRWRRTMAMERGVDPQVVLPGHCLTQLAEQDAETPDALAAVRGFGALRLARDGEALLAQLTAVRTAQNPSDAIPLPVASEER